MNARVLTLLAIMWAIPGSIFGPTVSTEVVILRIPPNEFQDRVVNRITIISYAVLSLSMHLILLHLILNPFRSLYCVLNEQTISQVIRSRIFEAQ